VCKFNSGILGRGGGGTQVEPRILGIVKGQPNTQSIQH